jgi:hypothetical protein
MITAEISSLIALMMEAARTSETSADIQLRTRQYIPEDSELHTRRRENLKFHTAVILIIFRGHLPPPPKYRVRKNVKSWACKVTACPFLEDRDKKKEGGAKHNKQLTGRPEWLLK